MNERHVENHHGVWSGGGFHGVDHGVPDKRNGRTVEEIGDRAGQIVVFDQSGNVFREAT